MAIIYNGQQIAEISAKGFMYYNAAEISGDESRAVFQRLLDDVETVRDDYN